MSNYCTPALSLPAAGGIHAGATAEHVVLWESLWGSRAGEKDAWTVFRVRTALEKLCAGVPVLQGPSWVCCGLCPVLWSTKSGGENRSELAPGEAASPGCAKVCLGKDTLPTSELLVGAVPLQNPYPGHWQPLCTKAFQKYHFTHQIAMSPMRTMHSVPLVQCEHLNLIIWRKQLWKSCFFSSCCCVAEQWICVSSCWRKNHSSSLYCSGLQISNYLK